MEADPPRLNQPQPNQIKAVTRFIIIEKQTHHKNMNKEQRTIAELKQRIAKLEEKISPFKRAIPRPALMPGLVARSQPIMGSGLAEFWFGRKKNGRQSPR
ncbi:MAG: hypothetical protein WAO02_07975 [Verrucomicrobiia bacterium]